MKKQTKNIITRQGIEKKLYSDNQASLKHTALFFFVMLVVCGVASTIFIVAGFEVENLVIDIISVIFAAMVTVPAWVMLAGFVKDLIERKHLKNGDVEIVTLPLLYETEETRYTRRTRTEYKQYKFHFAGFDAHLVSSEQSERFTMGDEFYIVYYKGSKKIKMAYPLKMYEYKETEQ